MKPTIFVLFLVIISGCQPKVEEINYHEDECHHCKMIISDSKFGAELVTKKGKVSKYDSAECMLKVYGTTSPEIYAFALVTDYANQGNLIDAKSAFYLISENLPSPMGANLSAYSNQRTAIEMQEKKGGNVLGFDEVLNHINNDKTK